MVALKCSLNDKLCSNVYCSNFYKEGRNCHSGCAQFNNQIALAAEGIYLEFKKPCTGSLCLSSGMWS